VCLLAHAPSNHHHPILQSLDLLSHPLDQALGFTRIAKLAILDVTLVLLVRQFLAGFHGTELRKEIWLCDVILRCCLVRRITCGYPWPELEGKRIWYDPRAIEVVCLVFEWLIGLTCMYCVWHGKVGGFTCMYCVRHVKGHRVLVMRDRMGTPTQYMICWFDMIGLNCMLACMYSRDEIKLGKVVAWIRRQLAKFTLMSLWEWTGCPRGSLGVVCYEKVVRIPLEGDEILRVHGERTQGVVKTLLNTKEDEPKFRIDLIPEATSVAKSQYRLAPLEMQELSEQLRELQAKVLELLGKEKLDVKVASVRQ
ncbi:hypothetical protein Tco_0919449, partial [Tanacetum coccineum]